jgi:hypothetical protein
MLSAASYPCGRAGSQQCRAFGTKADDRPCQIREALGSGFAAANQPTPILRPTLSAHRVAHSACPLLPELGAHDRTWSMNKLLEQAIAEIVSLPEDQQEAMAARILDEIRRRPARKGRWAQVADRLARLDALQGNSEAFVQHTRELRDSFRLHGTPNG